MAITAFLLNCKSEVHLVSLRSRYDDDVYVVLLPTQYVKPVTNKIRHGTTLETRELEDKLMLNPNYPGAVTWDLVEGIKEVEMKLVKTDIDRMKRYLKKNIDEIINKE